MPVDHHPAVRADDASDHFEARATADPAGQADFPFAHGRLADALRRGFAFQAQGAAQTFARGRGEMEHHGVGVGRHEIPSGFLTP